MKLESRFTYALLGTIWLAAGCGGDGTQTSAGSGSDGGGAGDGGDGGSASGTGGSSSGSGGSGGSSSGSGGSGGTAGSSTGGSSGSGGDAMDGGSGTGGQSSDGGPGGDDAAASPDGAATDGGPGSDDAGAVPDSGGGDADAGPPPPAPAGVVGFVYANKESSVVGYAPQSNYAYNASGGNMSIERIGEGHYVVDFADVDTPMRNAQATAYNFSGYCVVSQFGTTSATVRCYDNDGAAADAKFTLAAFGPAESEANVTAYVYADKESTAQYGPNGHYSYNSAAGSMVAHRSATGTYSLDLNDLSLSSGNVQVSAVNSDNHCNVSSWSGNTVYVACYDADG